ncbi:unnamed protein product [Orchesella dallaii]|uniref:C2H2-type domain-containing protein n=1 Tax=Orchesella dallaii TaxID=48710 RepID=A0ABP1RVV0_9HEXA
MSSIHNQGTITMSKRLGNLTKGDDNLDDLPSRCFICYCWRDNETLTTSSKPQSALSKNLLVVFVLQKLFALPSENVCHYLKKFGEPAEWIWFCKSCTSKIEDAKGIHKQLLWLEGWFRKVKNKLKDDIKDSVPHRPVDRKRKSMQANLKITDELREAVLNQKEVDGSGDEPVPHTSRVSIPNRSGFSELSTSAHPLERSSQRMKTDAVRGYADRVEQKRSNQLIEKSYSEEDREIKCEQLSPPTSPACVSDDDDEDMDYYPSSLDPDKSDYCHSDATNHTTTTGVGVGPYRCEVKDCNFEFQATNDLRIHLFEKHGRFINKGRTRPLEVYEIEKCTVCDLSFPAYSFEMHMKIHHSKQPNSGNETENGASTMDSTLSSNEICNLWPNHESNPEKFECTICLKNQSNQKLLDQHLKLHKSSPYNCFVCLSVVKDGNTLYNHMYRCHPEYKSSFSSSKAAKLNELEGVKVYKAVKNVKCSKCIRFLPLAQMSEHMELHERSPYHCNICRTVYDDKLKLYNHFRKYHKEKPVEMDKLRIALGIKKQKNISSIRKARISILKTERRKKNEKCSKCTRYIPLSEMSEHMELHEKSPYSCHFCGNVFNDKQTLSKHYLKYHNEDKMTLDKIRTDLGIQKSMKGRINSQTKHDALENKATIEIESDSNENEGDTEPMDDNDDEWKPPQSKHHVTPRVNQKYTGRRQKSTERGEDKPNTGLRKLTDRNRKKISCPLCVQFQCYIDKRENLCEHLESCKGFDENTNEEFIELEQFCPMCSNFKCSVAEKSDFIKHLMGCRGATTESSEAEIPPYERLYQCNLCPTTKYFNLNTFLKHFVFHKENIHKCSKCPRRFSLTCSVRRHWKKNHQESMKVQHSRRFISDFAVPDVPWWCSVCNERFDNEERRDLHLQTMHQKEVSKTHICQHCSKGFSCPEELKLHQGISHVSANSSYNCFICQERFLTATLRRLHMNGKHGPERLVCDVCGIECRTKGILKMHLQIHQEVRDFVCAECGKSFTTREK